MVGLSGMFECDATALMIPMNIYSFKCTLCGCLSECIFLREVAKPATRPRFLCAIVILTCRLRRCILFYFSIFISAIYFCPLLWFVHRSSWSSKMVRMCNGAITRLFYAGSRSPELPKSKSTQNNSTDSHFVVYNVKVLTIFLRNVFSTRADQNIREKNPLYAMNVFSMSCTTSSRSKNITDLCAINVCAIESGRHSLERESCWEGTTYAKPTHSTLSLQESLSAIRDCVWK